MTTTRGILQPTTSASMTRSNVTPFPAPAKSPVSGVHLSPRETELAALISEGLPDKEIAYRMGLSIETVKAYNARLRLKLGAASRVGVAVWWVRRAA